MQSDASKAAALARTGAHASAGPNLPPSSECNSEAEPAPEGG
jgi:hypothetical protein